MKILYAIQGTGNGHVCRAMEIVPLLSQKAEVDVLISGTQADIPLPFAVKYKLNGLGFIFGKKGGVDLLNTYRKSHIRRLLKEVKALPVETYDLVISDFEPVSAWACLLKQKPCVALSHQAAILDPMTPKPKRADPVGKSILKVYAPSSVQYGFHFVSYSENIFTPVIRSEIRTATISNHGHYTVYLPAYSDKRIIKFLSCFPGVNWHVFSKHFTEPVHSGNIILSPVNNNEFVKSMASSMGVFCGAGFETPAEALFMGKKLMVIPMKNQYEQHCNAAALKAMGVPVLKNLKSKRIPQMENWLNSDERIQVDYADQSQKIIDLLLHAHTPENTGEFLIQSQEITVKDFRKLTLRKILSKISG